MYSSTQWPVGKERPPKEGCLNSYLVPDKDPQEVIRSMELIIQNLSAENLAIKNSLIEEQEVKKTINRFISIASHEFRSPLSSIQLSAEVIMRYYSRLDKKKIFSHLHSMQTAVMDMTSTLNDFISVERIGLRNIQPSLMEFDLKAFLQEITADMQLMLKHGQTLRCEYNSNVAKCRLDRNLLKHCLVNLISNAIKYSNENGEIELECSILGSRCEIRIQDNGIGIPKEDQPRIFDAFFRAGNTGDIAGTGLGLNIVNQYVRLMSGNILFESSAETGTCFLLSFPI